MKNPLVQALNFIHCSVINIAQYLAYIQYFDISFEESSE